MNGNIILPATVFALIVLVGPAIPTFASTTVQQILSPNMSGFAFASSGCCPDVSTNLNGIVVTSNDGTMESLQQSGTITIGTDNYNLQFNPTGKLEVQTFNNSCSSRRTYNQDGLIILTGNDGTIIKGSGKFSWGSSPDCSGGTYTFTNFSGHLTDSAGQITNFYTGTDLLPSFQ